MNVHVTRPSLRSGEYITTREAAERLGVSLRTAQLWVDGGVLEAWKTEGGHRRISAASVEKLRNDQAGLPASASEVSAAGLAPPVGKLKILVVEDDNTLLRLYHLHMAGWNLPVEITTAANGYDALVLIGREQPDLMLLDLNMPGIDGFQMVHSLTISSFREGMEIAVVTGMEPEDIAARGGLPLQVKVFFKPIPFGEIKALVQSMLARRAALARA